MYFVLYCDSTISGWISVKVHTKGITIVAIHTYM